MKKIWIIIAAIVAAVAIGAGGFYGGIVYNRSQGDQIRTDFMRSRGMNPAQQTPGAPGQGFFGGNITGQIKSIDGNTLTVSTPRDVTTITITSDTNINKSTTASSTDLQPGKSVMVTGQRDDNGNLTATQILIMDNNLVMPTPGGTP